MRRIRTSLNPFKNSITWMFALGCPLGFGDILVDQFKPKP
jgi:hypothetical protein